MNENSHYGKGEQQNCHLYLLGKGTPLVSYEMNWVYIKNYRAGSVFRSSGKWTPL